MDELLARIPGPLLWLGATLGHAFWITVALNVLFAQPFHYRLLRTVRKIAFPSILAGPAFFALGLALDFGALFRAYALLCFVLGLGVAPICQILYWSRRTAPQLTAQTSQRVDMTQVLGYVPSGEGRDAPKCLWPGNQVFQVEFNEKVLTLPQLPAAWDGLTILHLTDLHLCGSPDKSFHQAVIDRCLAQGAPDLVAMTGDVADSDRHHTWIVPVLGRLRWNLAGFAILGNHDHYYDPMVTRRRLHAAGFDVLGNAWRQIDVRGQPMTVIGHEGPWFGAGPDLSDCPAGGFRLCLSHSPDSIAWARRARIDLMLAGHVHGGQIRLPLLGSIIVPSKYSRQYDAGTFYRDPTVMHVSRGVAGQHPLRYLCPPEVTRIVLRRGSSG